MKATGIVRRIDDLGRVVIPKEIRRTLRIREGDPLEIFVDRQGEIILKKYSPISELRNFATEYADALFDSLHSPVLITDRDEIIAVSGASKNDYLNNQIGADIEEAMQERMNELVIDDSTLEIVRGNDEQLSSYVVSTIIANGDSIGSVIIFNKDGEKLTEVELKVAETAANFLGNQME